MWFFDCSCTVKGDVGLLPECSVGYPERRRFKLKHAWQVSLGSYGRTDHQQQAAHRPYGAGLRLLQVRAAHKKGTHERQRSAHDFIVKLSLSMGSHSSCLGWRNVTTCDLTSTKFSRQTILLCAHNKVEQYLAQARPTMLNHLTSKLDNNNCL